MTQLLHGTDQDGKKISIGLCAVVGDESGEEERSPELYRPVITAVHRGSEFACSHPRSLCLAQLVQPVQVAAIAANRATIEAWLRTCIQALRNYQTRYVVSLDAPSSGNEDSQPLSEIISDDLDSDSVLEQLEIQEPAELVAVLAQFLKRIDYDTDNLLLLRYGFDLDYSSIAAIFFVPNSTLRSRCNQATRALLGQVFRYVEEKLRVTPESETISSAHAALKKCLNKHYYDLLFRLVFQQALRLDLQRLEILRLYYIRHDTRKNEAQIARALQLPESEVNNGLATGRQELAAAIANWIQNRLNVPPDSDSLNPLTDKITSLVEEWLPAICTISLTCHD